MNRARWLSAIAVACLLLAPQVASAAGSGSFRPTGSMTVARTGAVAAPLGDGRILVAGGQNFGYFQSAETFNPATNTFAQTGPMGTPRTYAAAAPLPDGRVLVAGGFDGSMNLASAEIFNPATNSFSPTSGPMSTPRYGATAAELPDGRVVVVGGSSSSDSDVYNPATGTFTSVSTGITSRLSAAAPTPIPAPLVLVVGGQQGSTYLDSAVLLLASLGLHVSGASPMSTPRLAPGAAPLPDGRVLVVGGQSGPFSYLSSAEVFIPAMQGFSSAGIGSMGTPRGSPAAAPLPDGRVLVAGGFDGSEALSSAEIFAATNTFSFKVKGKRLVASVQASGKVTVSDAAAPLSVSTAKKRKLLLKPSSGSGDPPTVPVTLHLTKLGKTRLRQKGKLKIRARITFAPQGGLANSQTAKLKIKTKTKTKTK